MESILIGADDMGWIAQAQALASACAAPGGGVGVPGARRTLLGFPQADLALSATGQSYSLTVRTTPGFVGRRPVFPNSKVSAGSIHIQTVVVNQNTQIMSSTDPLPTEAFGTLAPNPQVLPFSYAPLNATIAMTLSNDTASAITAVNPALEGAII